MQVFSRMSEKNYISSLTGLSKEDPLNFLPILNPYGIRNNVMLANLTGTS